MNRDKLTDETIRDWRETDMQWNELWSGVNRFRVVCDELLKTRGDFERCSDHAATLGIENDKLRARVRECEQELAAQQFFDAAYGELKLDKEHLQKQIIRGVTEYDTLREAVNRALNELGVPQLGYPCPVANAVEILREALTKGGDDDKKNKS